MVCMPIKVVILVPLSLGHVADNHHIVDIELTSSGVTVVLLYFQKSSLVGKMDLPNTLVVR